MMTELTSDEASALRLLLRALGEARDDFVVSGGQAARLFRLHPLATPPRGQRCERRTSTSRRETAATARQSTSERRSFGKASRPR